MIRKLFVHSSVCAMVVLLGLGCGGGEGDGGNGNGNGDEAAEAAPGFVRGTVYDTQGRPLAGAGVLISGTTFEQGQRTSFDAVTDANGVYSIRVPDGRYEAKAWIDREFDGHLFSRLLHPRSGNPNTQIDSTVGGTLDFEWRLAGLTAYSTPPGSDATDFYGASIDLSYCGLPAGAYCADKYTEIPAGVAQGGARVVFTLTPQGNLIDGTAGMVVTFETVLRPVRDDYPLPAGGGRLVLGTDWEYQSHDLNDIPLGIYTLTAEAIATDGTRHPFKLGLEEDDVEHASLELHFDPWEDYQARSYTGGGILQRTVHLRD
jgi:Carboxypeptidase regulatory-like domain